MQDRQRGRIEQRIFDQLHGRLFAHAGWGLPLECVQFTGKRRNRLPFARHNSVGNPGLVERCTNSARQPVTHAAAIAMLGLFQLGHHEKCTPHRFRAQNGLQVLPGLIELSCVECRAGNRHTADRRICPLTGQRLDALQTIHCRIPGAHMGIGFCEIRMRRDTPCALDQFGSLADIALARCQPGGQHGGRHQIERQSMRFLCQ